MSNLNEFISDIDLESLDNDLDDLDELLLSLPPGISFTDTVSTCDESLLLSCDIICTLNALETRDDLKVERPHLSALFKSVNDLISMLVVFKSIAENDSDSPELEARHDVILKESVDLRGHCYELEQHLIQRVRAGKESI